LKKKERSALGFLKDRFLMDADITQQSETHVLAEGTRPHTSEFLHVASDPQKQSKVNTEGTDVGTSLTGHPENAQVPVVVELVQLQLVDGTNTQLTLNGRDERRTLEKSTGQGLQSLKKKKKDRIGRKTEAG
jgi:hypothetical protein